MPIALADLFGADGYTQFKYGVLFLGLVFPSSASICK
jgi:hypothetical protein